MRRAQLGKQHELEAVFDFSRVVLTPSVPARLCRRGARPLRANRRTPSRTTQLESFKSAIKEGVDTAVREEPRDAGLLCRVQKENPPHATVFDIYTDANAYACAPGLSN